MPDLAAPDSSIARLLIERGLALIYLSGFVVAIRQFPALAGEHGLTPCTRILALVPFRRAPSIFHWRYSDRLLIASCWAGVVVSAALVVGLPQRAPLPVTMLAWLLLWVLYQSIVNIGGTWYGFGWETLLLEAGFLAIFLGNDDDRATLAGDPRLPMAGVPGRVRRRADQAARRSVLARPHVHGVPPRDAADAQPAELVRASRCRGRSIGWRRSATSSRSSCCRSACSCRSRSPSLAAALMIATQLYLIVSGNYAWLNWLTLIALVAAPPTRRSAPCAGPAAARPGGLDAAAWFAAALVVAVHR